MINTNTPMGYHIGCATNTNDRFRASSGGVGTSIIRYLLSLPDYGTSITFTFDVTSCMYVPKLIYSEDDINICGSIYQDIDLIKFVKENIQHIQGGMVITCAPCQVVGIRQLLNRNNIKNFILSFCCSGQTTIEGTWQYYHFLGIKKDDIINMQYRGNGWPSGIQIWLKNGNKIYHDNYTEPWRTIHLSGLYRPKRCYYCKYDTGRNADITMADPWLDKYKNEKLGKTLFLVNTEKGQCIFEALSQLNLIESHPSDYNTYAIAQRPNIQKELKTKTTQTNIKYITSLIERPIYHKWATANLSNMRKHIILTRLIKKSILKSIFQKMTNLLRKISNYLQRNKYKKVLGRCDNNVNISRQAVIHNPQCIYIDKNVGIGDGVYLGPVIEYADIPYNPKIIIGEGTWIGNHCSLAAINKIKIGKNVLFAGYVHITDHSHGYEDIDRHIALQPLTSKGPIIIEDDCWLGFSCEILSGVHIGKHSIIAARAVVTKDVPPYSIVAGNPAHIIKQYNFKSQQWERYNK